MSNHDLLDWCKYLKIPINTVLSRDQNVPHNHKHYLFTILNQVIHRIHNGRRLGKASVQLYENEAGEDRIRKQVYSAASCVIYQTVVQRRNSL